MITLVEVTELIPPPAGVPYYKYRTLLTGSDYEVAWSYNSRTESWSISIGVIGDQTSPAGEATPVLSGAKLHIGFDLLRRCRHPLRPPGELWVYSSDGSHKRPGMSDLGSRVHVIYAEPGDLA